MQPEAIKLAVFAAAFVASTNRIEDAGEVLTDSAVDWCIEDALSTADLAMEAYERFSAKK